MRVPQVALRPLLAAQPPAQAALAAHAEAAGDALAAQAKLRGRAERAEAEARAARAAGCWWTGYGLAEGVGEMPVEFGPSGARVGKPSAEKRLPSSYAFTLLPLFFRSELKRQFAPES